MLRAVAGEVARLDLVLASGADVESVAPSSLFTGLSDHELLEEVKCLAARERQATARLIASLAEFDRRRLYLGEGCSCLFTYCVQVLHLSEHEAFNRIEAARAARRYPLILDRLGDGSVHLTAVRLLAPKLTDENHRTVLDAARHKSKREIQQLIATMNPQPDVPASVRKLPAASRPLVEPLPTVVVGAEMELPDSKPMITPPSPPVRPPVVSPLSAERYRVQLTVSKETHDKLRHVQDLMRHRVPNGDPAVIFDRALTALLAELERSKLAATKRPRATPAVSTTSRHVPATVKRAVWARDGGQCAFVGRAGRCRETGFLEFHHVIPHAAGGETSVENLELRAHNAYEAEKYFGNGSLFVRERGSGTWSDVEVVPERVSASAVAREAHGQSKGLCWCAVRTHGALFFAVAEDDESDGATYGGRFNRLFQTGANLMVGATADARRPSQPLRGQDAVSGDVAIGTRRVQVLRFVADDRRLGLVSHRARPSCGTAPARGRRHLR